MVTSTETTQKPQDQRLSEKAAFRILVVDDEQRVLQVIKEMLEDNGYQAVAFSSPVEALQKAKRSKFDALVLDVYMPEMSGMLFHAKLRVFDPDLAARTVFVSGYVSREELREHLSATPAFLDKPFNSSALCEMVGKVLPPRPRQ